MEELNIEIETQELKKYGLQSSIAKPFGYGRSPGDDEYLDLAETTRELQKVEYALHILRQLKDSIAHNRRVDG